MKRWIFCLVLLCAAPLHAQDGIDPSSIVWHGPAVLSYPIGAVMSGVEFKPGTAAQGNTVGVRPIFAPRTWPDVTPPGWEGPIQYTLCAVVKVSQAWHGACLQEFWRDREWSGAPILTQWPDWVYRSQWGSQMESYAPMEGDEIGFFVVAGDRRLMDIGPVRERSNIIRVTLIASGVATPIDGPVTSLPPPQSPVYTVISTEQVSALENSIGALATKVNELEAQLRNASEGINRRVNDALEGVAQRLEKLEARKVPTSCRVTVFGMGLSCRLETP